ncbi:hypothetical protein M2G68_08820 [Vibrio vulnificus]|nr:hypothetical protein [Vibrio vulnificus]
MKSKLTLLALLLAMNPLANAAQWDYPEERVTLNSAEQVQQFVQQHYADQGEFKLRYQTTSLLGHHYNFDVWQHGQYQQQKSLVVTTDQQHRVARVFRSLENTVLLNGEPTTAVELEHPRRLEVDFPPALEQGELETVEIHSTLIFARNNNFRPQAVAGTAWMTTLARWNINAGTSAC